MFHSYVNGFQIGWSTFFCEWNTLFYESGYPSSFCSRSICLSWLYYSLWCHIYFGSSIAFLEYMQFLFHCAYRYWMNSFRCRMPFAFHCTILVTLLASIHVGILLVRSYLLVYLLSAAGTCILFERVADLCLQLVVRMTVWTKVSCVLCQRTELSCTEIQRQSDWDWHLLRMELW